MNKETTPKAALPACFNKKELALALERKTKTSFFFPSGNINSRRLRRYLLSFEAYRSFLEERQESYGSLSYFSGLDAVFVCELLGLDSLDFYG